VARQDRSLKLALGAERLSSPLDWGAHARIFLKQVALVAPRRWQPAGGAELAISYGDKSNEELLFHYGAALLVSQHAAYLSHGSW
jgi:hypothetical protein